MTGTPAPLKRLPSARRVNCGGCKTSFIPKRRGAVFCSDRCQKAETRRLARVKAEALFQPKQDFKAVLSIARATSRKRDWFQQWSSFGAYREEWCKGVAEALACRGVRFVGTVLGVFAIEDRPGALQAVLDGPWRAVFEKAASEYWGGTEAFDGSATVVECTVDDPRLIKAILPPLVGGDWQDRKNDAKYGALLLKGVSRAILFSVAFPETKTVKVYASRPQLEKAEAEDYAASLNDIFSGTGYSVE